MEDREQNQGLDKITAMLVGLSQGNFDIRAELSYNDDPFNVVLSGLNMLAEELSYFKAQLDIKTSLLENTLYNISEVVYVIRIAGGRLDDIKHEFVSQRVNDLIGYSVDEIYHNSTLWFNAIHPDDRDHIQEILKQLSSGEEVTCEYRLLSKTTNTYIWVEDRMSPKKGRNDADTTVFCAARNVSLRKKLNEEREQLLKELSTKYNELTQFNYIVSHNLRSPVAGILGACNILNMELEPEERSMAYELITQAATKLDNLLKDLNTILSAKSKINEKVEVFSISEMLSDIVELLKTEIDASNALVVVEVTPKANMVRTIKGYLHSSLYNLLSNAIKYRKPDIQPKIVIKVWKEYQTTYIEVTDNGIGIDMSKYKNQLFGLYKRFNTHTEGKGLGLHMTKVQIESLGGSILVDSTPDEGTRFMLHLPQ